MVFYKTSAFGRLLFSFCAEVLIEKRVLLTPIEFQISIYPCDGRASYGESVGVYVGIG